MEGSLILTGCLLLVTAKLVVIDYLTTTRRGRNAMLIGEAIVAALVLAAVIALLP